MVEAKADKVRRGLPIKMIGLPQTRVLVTQWVGEAWQDLCVNHKNLLRSAWKGSKLLLKLDGTEDGFD